MYTLKLEDFDYEINGDNLILKKIINENEKDIKLLDKYTIDDKDYIVNEISEFAFTHKLIENIELPNTIEIIGRNAFSGIKIEKFVCPPKVTEIPDGCFQYDEKLKNVVLHDKIEFIGENAFSNTGIEKFVCPPLVTEIPEGCFECCSELTDIILHDKIEKIGSNTFSFSGIQKFICPSKVTEIPYGCFECCSDLTDIILHDNIKYIEINSFFGTGIEKFVVPPKVTEIPYGCFNRCEKINEIIFHDNFKEIKEYSFAYSGLKKITIPPKVTEIPIGCFFQCEKLKEIDLNNVNLIRKDAFGKCKKLNISYQNYKNIHIDYYDELIDKGFSDGQINQIFKGYKKQIFLNDLPNDTPVDVFRIIINEFKTNINKINDIIKQLENNDINLFNKIDLYNEINKLNNCKDLDNREIEHTM